MRILALLALLPCAANGAQAEALVYHGASSGAQTLDEGEGGGNPFASAFIAALSKPSVELAEFSSTIARLTHEKSGGFQTADVPSSDKYGRGKVVSPVTGNKGIALVLVVSDYAQAHGAQSLPGAKRDAERVVVALNAAGFATELILDAELLTMQQKLAQFAQNSAKMDTAVIYTTGHGVEVDGKVYLLPGNFPVRDGNAALHAHALSLAEIAQSARGKAISLVLYGGCRDNPFK